jgi:tight adherence protein B
MRSIVFDSAWGTVAVAVAVGCMMLTAALVALARPRGAWLRGRLEPYGSSHAASAGGGAGLSEGVWRPHVETAVTGLERVFGDTRLYQWAQLRLDRAGSDQRPGELLLVSLGISVGAAAGAGALGLGTGVMILALVVGAVLPTFRLVRRASRRRNAFDDQLPDVLMSMASSLKVGQSFNQAMHAVIAEGREPASSEFRRVMNETRLGLDLDDALRGLDRRIDSEDLGFVLMSVAIQREIGGSLADLFQTISDTVRQRQQFRRKVHALTSMGRATAYLLVALPFLTAGALGLLNPGYLAPLFQTSAGRVLLAIMLSLMTVGTLILKKIVTIKG